MTEKEILTEEEILFISRLVQTEGKCTLVRNKYYANKLPESIGCSGFCFIRGHINDLCTRSNIYRIAKQLLDQYDVSAGRCKSIWE